MSPHPTVANILGPIAIGTILSSIIYGINCLQAYLYYTRCSGHDSMKLKIYVAMLMAVDSVHLALLVLTSYHYTVECFGDALSLTYFYWPIQVQVTIGSLLGTLVQLYFILRIYYFCGKRVLPIIMCSLSITKLALSVAYAVIGLHVGRFTVNGDLRPFNAAGFGCSITCDSLIAASLIYYLHVKRSVFPRTNKALNLLTTYALNTCLVNVVLSLINLITFLILFETAVYIVVWYVLVRVYTCSMLSTLNSRENVRKVFNNQERLTFASAEFGNAAVLAD